MSASNWTQAYARALGIKWTPQVGARLESWQRWEGGSTHNSATNNYMNTKQSMPGSWDAIGNGVQGYKTLAQGAQAFANTIDNGNYSPALKTWLATGQGDPSHDLGVWVAGPGGADSPSARSYASKVLGSNFDPGSSNGRTPGSEPGNDGSIPSLGTAPSLLTADTGAAQIRQQAMKGFASIASGGSATANFGDLSGLIHTLKTTAPPPTLSPTFQQAADANPSSLEGKAATLVQKYLGVKYTWGGTSAKTGFDCSGLIQTVWKSLGVNIPRTTYAQWDSGTPVAKGQLRPGDAVYFVGSDPMNGKPGHVGMYLGDGKFIEAPGRGQVVHISNLADRKDYVGARRWA